MKIRIGFELVYEFAQKTSVVLMLNVHPSRTPDLIQPDHIQITPAVPLTRYRDAFDNLRPACCAAGPAQSLHRCGHCRLRSTRPDRAGGTPARRERIAT